MKFLTTYFHDKRGEIGTIAVLIGMAVVGLGILVGSQLREQNINIAPRATASADPIWSTVKPAPGNIFPWTAGPTAGWESFLGNRVYICKGEWCWTIVRANNETYIDNNGSPFQMSQNSAYNVKATGDRLPWSGSGPTAAWTWVVPYNNQTVNETLICNGSLCWRYIRYSNGSGEWRDGGTAINLSELAFWKDRPQLYTNNGPTTGWTDPINKKTTLCNGTYCQTVNYSNWTWEDVPRSQRPTTPYTAAWTSPATNVQTLCVLNSCQNFTTRSGAEPLASDSILIAAPTNTQAPTARTTEIKCAAGQLLCANVCTDVTNNNQHCGACGNVCNQGQVCTNGTCAAPVTSTVKIGIIEAEALPSSYNAPTVAAYKVNTSQKIANCSTTTIGGRTRGYNCAGLTTGTNYTYKAVYTPKNSANPTITVQINGNAYNTSLFDLRVTFSNKVTISPTSPNASQSVNLTVTGKKLASPVAILEVAGGISGRGTLSDSAEITTGTFSKTFTVPPVAAGTYKVSISVTEGYKATIPGSKLTYEYFTFTVAPAPTSTPQPPTATRTPSSTPRATSTPSPTTRPNAPTPTTRPAATATTRPVATATTQPVATVTPVDDCPLRGQGDANCDGQINLADYACIVGELSNRKPGNCESSDFDGVGGDRPTSADHGIWLTNYNESKDSN